MKINLSLFVWGGIIFSNIYLLSFMGYTKYNDNSFSCEAKVNIIEKYGKAHILMNFIFTNGTGVYTSNGNYISADGEDKKINTKINFTYLKKNNESIIVFLNPNQSMQHNANSSALNYNFFAFQEKSFVIKTIRQNSSGYLFFKSDSPLFHCSSEKKRFLFW
ncbi:TPA: hypothetical protein ACKP1B_004335 [Serratia fonticola]